MTTDAHRYARRALTPLQWLICVIAAIGFAFDSYELLMLPLIVRPALTRAAAAWRRTARSINDWVGIIFYVPAVAGGIFGLLGGYLTDLLRPPPRARLEHPALRALGVRRRLCRRRSTWLLFWRCCTFVGVCVEFVAAVAWLAELFPNPKQREAVVGYTQAFGSVGGIMVDRRATTSSSPTATCCRPFTAGTKRGATR